MPGEQIEYPDKPSLVRVPITDSPAYRGYLAFLCRRQHCKISRTHFNRRSARYRAPRRNLLLNERCLLVHPYPRYIS